MAIFQIPVLENQADFKVRTDIEGTTYVLRIYWNTREERWHLSIMDADENPLVMGIPLNVDTDVIGRFRVDGLPPGIIMLYDTAEKHEQAGKDDLGQRHLLLYMSAS